MDIFDIFDKIFSAISHLNFLTIFLTIFTLSMIGLLILLGVSTSKSRIEYYNFAMNIIKTIINWIKKKTNATSFTY